ncbi:MAG: helix-turn-helix transcriptional regulator [Bacillota bacterium]|jgi:transcriptional regulator with XRE-family HTH domain|nr:helix-turn-helix transcriptional regulator [Bacillota bacterium]
MIKSTNRLRELREERGKSGTEIADLLEISPQYYYDLEKGVKRLNEPLIRKLTEIYGVSSDYLLGYADDPRPLPHEGEKSQMEYKSDIEEQWPEVANVLRRSGKKPTPKERRRIARIIEAAIEDTSDD